MTTLLPWDTEERDKCKCLGLLLISPNTRHAGITMLQYQQINLLTHMYDLHFLNFNKTKGSLNFPLLFYLGLKYLYRESLKESLRESISTASIRKQKLPP